jgi:hypothetical protein
MSKVKIRATLVRIMVEIPMIDFIGAGYQKPPPNRRCFFAV